MNYYSIISNTMKYGILILVFTTLVSSQRMPFKSVNDELKPDNEWNVQHERNKAEYNFLKKGIEEETEAYLAELKFKTK